MVKEVKEAKELKVTSIEELIEASKGELVELPGFNSDSTFVARMKRPSLLGMAKAGRIPNSLLQQANELFTGGAGGALNSAKIKKDDLVMGEVFDIMEVLCEEAFVEPTYKQLKENGIVLTDEQLLFIFTYTQRGLDALQSFRS